MAELTVNIPDSTIAAVMVSLSFDATGEPQVLHAVEYPHPEYESLGRASVHAILRKLAAEFERDAPGVVTLPAHDDEDSSTEEEYP